MARNRKHMKPKTGYMPLTVDPKYYDQADDKNKDV